MVVDGGCPVASSSSSPGTWSIRRASAQPAARPDSYKHFTARYKSSLTAKVGWGAVFTVPAAGGTSGGGGMALWFLGVFLLPPRVLRGLPGAADHAPRHGGGHPVGSALSLLSLSHSPSVWSWTLACGAHHLHLVPPTSSRALSLRAPWGTWCWGPVGTPWVMPPLPGSLHSRTSHISHSCLPVYPWLPSPCAGFGAHAPTVCPIPGRLRARLQSDGAQPKVVGGGQVLCRTPVS